MKDRKTNLYVGYCLLINSEIDSRISQNIFR